MSKGPWLIETITGILGHILQKAQIKSLHIYSEQLRHCLGNTASQNTLNEMDFGDGT